MSADLALQSTTFNVTEAEAAELQSLLGIPDSSGIDFDALSPQTKVEIRKSYETQLASAMAIIAELTRPVRETIARCDADILRAIPAGATMLPQENFDVKKNIRYERTRDVATLRADLPGTELPAEELVKIVFPKTVDARSIDPDALDALMQLGAKVEWECDLRKADVAARTYGGEIAAIIEKATKKVEVGTPFLTITAKESALKRVVQ